MCAVMSYSGSLSRKKLYSARSKDRKNGNRKKDNPQPADPLREATPEKHSMRKRFDIIEYCSSCGGESGHRFEERGCVKMLAQLFFMRKAQTFPSPGFVIT